ncbi:MAG: ABC transporter permease [Acidobacteria bacterium]|nr:ABC transporter permease [Acidobacteriota bacterium]
MQTLFQDLRYGIRQLLKSPGFTAVGVLSLALGIGANTALFSLVDAVLLKTLPVRKPEELALFKWTIGPRGISFSHSGTIMGEPGTGLRVGTSFSVPAFEQMRAHTQTLSDLFAFASRGDLNVSVDGQAEMASGQLVSGNFQTGLGVQPALGRTITNDDDQTSANPVAVISFRYWQRRFGLDPAVVGKTINVNSAPFTIVGVTPPQFYSGMEMGDSPDLALPLSLAPRLDPSGQTQSEMTQAWVWWVQMMGRTKPGVNLEQVRAELEGVYQQSAQAGWESLPRRPSNAGSRELPRLRALPGGQGEVYLRQSYEQPLRVMLIVVGLTLLVACANIANLLLARAVTRRQEMAVRLSLGAGRFRLVRQLLTESLLLAFTGSSLGWLLAWLSKGLLLMWSPGRGSQLDAELHMDWRVFGFTAAVAVLTGLLFGLAPALRATRVDLNSALKENARGAKGSLSVLGKSLVIAQVAVSLVLLVGAGLFIRTLHNLSRVTLGFNAENLLLFSLDPRAKGYSNEQMVPLYQQVCERIEAVPGVRSATISEFAALSGSGRNSSAYAEGRAPAPQAESNVFQQRVRWNYIQTMEIPLLAGRNLTPQDDERAPRVAVINQMMARRFFGDENPLGNRFGFGSVENSGQIEIVGVARDSRYRRPRQEIPSIAYLPFPQHSLGRTTFTVRTAGDPTQMTAAIRAAVRDVDKDLPLFGIKTQTEQMDQSLAQERFFPKLTSFFGLLALLLASVGLYGVMSYAVAQRTHEIGIRMALGASRENILRRVIGQGMLLAAIGVVIGSAAAFALMRLITSNATYELTRFISGFLYGVRATDPLTFVAVALLLVMVALLACYLPARRATKVDPMVALRCE